jgi:hypothetical protein
VLVPFLISIKALSNSAKKYPSSQHSSAESSPVPLKTFKKI